MESEATRLREYVQAASEAAQRAGAVIEEWRARFVVRSKGRADLVTEADEAAQAVIQAYLGERYPDHAFLGEEHPSARGQNPLASGRPIWIVDPLDGTTNYVHDCPVYAVSIGLVVGGEVVAGVILDPTRPELFHAARGQGAWLDGRRLETTRVDRLDEALLATGFPPDLNGQEHTLEAWRYFSLRAQSLRRTGSTALNLAYVAAGRHDGFWAHQAWPWDAAAGVVLIREAGGVVSNLDGTPYDLATPDILASNDALHPALVRGFQELARLRAT
jgi:myo-inositol-1(or 4)-monophosphatase